MKERFIKHVAEHESRAHRRIIEIFRHNRIKPVSTCEALFDADLFSESTWPLFGLTQKQLIATAAAGGAAVGAATDALTAGHTLLIGTLAGGAIGAAGAYAAGKRRPEVAVNVPWARWVPRRWRKIDLSGLKITVGPYRAANFPWILLDRAFGIFYYASRRAHARQDNLEINSSVARDQMVKAGVSTSQWDAVKRKECEKLFGSIRKGGISREQRDVLLKMLGERLDDLGKAKVDADAS